MSDETAFRLTPAQAVAGINAIPSLPTAVLELMAEIDKESADAEQIARKIAQDQGLSARILRLANSPFYGQANRVGSITDALMVLGLRTVHSLATAAAVTVAFRVTPGSGLDLPSFWRHGIGAALCARALAPHLGVNAEEAFIAGLLHDIGRVALASGFPQHAAAVAAHRERYDGLQLDAERTLLGIDHAVVGQLLAERWHFPPALCEAIGQHHAPLPEMSRKLPGLLHLADALAHALDFAGARDAVMPRLSPGVWSAAALSWADTQALFAAVDTQFEALCDVLVN